MVVCFDVGLFVALLKNAVLQVYVIASTNPTQDLLHAVFLLEEKGWILRGSSTMVLILRTHVENFLKTFGWHLKTFSFLF